MLSLKATQIRNRSTFRTTTLNDIPEELLDIVVNFIYRESGGHTPSVIPASLTCHHLRRSAITFLFNTITVVTDDHGLSRRSTTNLRRMLAQPHVLEHVQCLQVYVSLPGTRECASDHDIWSSESQDLIRRCSLAMPRLRVIRFKHIPPRIVKGFWNGLVDKIGRFTSVQSATRYKEFQIPDNILRWQADFALPLSKVVINQLDKCSMNVPNDSASIIKEATITKVHAQSLSSDLTPLENLTELLTGYYEGATLPNWGPNPVAIVPWHNLRRLCLYGKTYIQNLLPLIAHELIKLESLHLTSTTTRTFHSTCQLEPDVGPVFSIFADAPLPKLRHFYLSGGCLHLPMSAVTTPDLESLQLVLPELDALPRGLNLARPASDITYLAKHCPRLSVLALHIGNLENLWHPTAIPGIDVDLSVYQVLSALSKLRNLKTLRLYPTYLPREQLHVQHRPANHPPQPPQYYITEPHQPLSDEQSIRLFRHLKSQGSRITLLSIGATFERVDTFRPMSWLVRDTGNGKTLLTTRQAGKDYEIEQVWVGERRLTTCIRRHAYRKPYMPALDDEEFPMTLARNYD